MTPEEKANEIYTSMFYKIPGSKGDHKAAKACAVVAVDLLIENLSDEALMLDTIVVSYWKLVRKEIRKL